MISGSRRDSVGGGGVVAEIFSDLRKPSRFSGGGVVAEVFRDLQTPARFSGGGSTVHFPLMGPFFIYYLFKRGAPFCIFGIFNRGDPLFHFLDFQKGGARAPRAPP